MPLLMMLMLSCCRAADLRHDIAMPRRRYHADAAAADCFSPLILATAALMLPPPAMRGFIDATIWLPCRAYFDAGAMMSRYGALFDKAQHHQIDEARDTQRAAHAARCRAAVPQSARVCGVERAVRTHAQHAPKRCYLCAPRRRAMPADACRHAAVVLPLRRYRRQIIADELVFITPMP